jgi:chemotaxis protein methyltransferase CheR
MEQFVDREFPMLEEDFWALSKLAYQHTGIVLGEHKKNLVYGRLSRRIRQLKLSSFKEYISLIESGTHAEFDEFLNTITTNLTSFFREEHHFDYLKSTIFPHIQSQRNETVRIWSAGCSTGEEPYSIALTVKNHFSQPSKVKILATDLDANVLKHGREGIYEASRLEGVNADLLKGHFKRDPKTGSVVAKDSLKEMIVFNRLNLLGNWPMKGLFDVIFCRNVLIYFDKETQIKLVGRYLNQLKSNGYLIIGHSENISRMHSDIEFIGQTIYRKRS